MITEEEKKRILERYENNRQSSKFTVGITESGKTEVFMIPDKKGNIHVEG